MSDEQVWPEGVARPFGPVPGAPSGANASGQQGQEQPVWPSAPAGPAPQGGPHAYGPYGYGAGGPGYFHTSPNGPSYGAQPPYGAVPYPAPVDDRRAGWRRGARASAAVVLLAAALVGGAGLSRTVFPSSNNGSNNNASSPGASGPSGGFYSPFGGTSGNSGANGGNSGGYSPFTPGGTSGNSGTSGSGPSNAAGSPSDVSAIAKEVDPAVVDINVTFNYQGAAGAGTGIVLTSNGLVLTNNHVIDGATKISVTDVGNHKTYSATVVGYDNTHDVALVKLQGASGLATAKIASTTASVGQAVVAIGNAGGAGGTPTSAGGSVTALRQTITASDSLDQTSEQLSGLIEVNANVEAGDSGGPLVNASGQVIGMDTAASQGFNFAASGNQGFAIPISQALAIAHQIESGKGSSVVHIGPTAFLGVMIQFQPSDGYQYGAGAGAQGAQICDQQYCIVSGGPAASAGLQPGDVITRFAGHTVSSGSSLTHLLVSFHPGQKVKVSWVDPTGASHSGTVQLASGPPA